MKKLLLLIVLIIGLSVVSNAENINECKTDVYYGNGVWNEYEDATDSKDELESLIKDEIINGDPLLKAKYGKVRLVYNWGQGYILDVLEVYYQLREAGQLDGIGFYTAIAALTVENPEIMLGVIATQTLMEPYTKDWEAGNVDEMWQKYYDESFELGHRVLLVSHSQGNLFANRIYETISPVEYQNYFANLQVASPANEVEATKGDHVTLYGDPIINPIPGSMEGNANGNPGHAFVNAYLDQEDPYTKVVTKMKQLLETLDSEGSQWGTDQEFERNTCDYKITVKHRFDDEIIMDEEVYPFAPSKKLYKVGNKWVKATCDGQNILDEWEGKQASECWMIDNLEEEKIKKESTVIYRDGGILLIVGYAGSSYYGSTYESYIDSDDFFNKSISTIFTSFGKHDVEGSGVLGLAEAQFSIGKQYALNMFTEYLENLKIQFPNYMIDFNTEVVYDEGCNLQYYSEGIARASCVQEIYGEVKVYE
ncbi:MAG: hypothetical protein QG567_1700 [Campylobacterota bacterium]|nr:hypothetical protein [Campylobacterota bacterium]